MRSAVLGGTLSRRGLDEWAGRIVRQGDEHTVQAYHALSQMPTWKSDAGDDHIVPRSVMLRVFAVSDGPQSWRVLPGGLARIASANAGHRLHAARRQQRRRVGGPTAAVDPPPAGSPTSPAAWPRAAAW
jgi:uncharacterized circularly permuted ATP-grasp superfamily protein